MASALALCAPVIAGILPTGGEPFPPGERGITFTARTNELPAFVWSYKVIPQTFAPPVVSNLMALGGFTLKDKTNVPGRAAFKDKSNLYFASKDRKRELGIFPSLGWVYYNDATARADVRGNVMGVPSEAEAMALALDHLRRLGIDRSQLSVKPESGELRAFRTVGNRGWLDEKTSQEVKRAILRGVMFPRRIDGFDVTGTGSAGGFVIDLGNDARVFHLNLVWRNLEPSAMIPLSLDQIARRIRAGQTVKTSPPPVDFSAVKKLEVYKITPGYLGQLGDEPQGMIYPFLDLEVKVDVGTTNVAFHLNCPLVD